MIALVYYYREPDVLAKLVQEKNETKRHIVHVTYRTWIITSKLIKSKSCQLDHPTTREEN